MPTAGFFAGAWQELPADQGGGVSFGSPGESAAAASLWRLDLPAGVEAAGEQVGQLEAEAQAADAALQALPDRLELLLGMARGVSFEAGAPALSPAEADFLRDLEEIQGRQAGLSFEAPGGWQQARQSFEEAAARFFRMVTHQAWVETAQDGRLLGRSALGWSGDLETIYVPGASPEQVSLHQRSLAAAVKTRHTVLRTFLFTAQGAAKLAVMVSTPAGLLLALPAVWKLASQVLAEVNGG